MVRNVVERLAWQLREQRTREPHCAETQRGRCLANRALQLGAHESPVELRVVRDEDVAGQRHYKLGHDLLEARSCRDHALADSGEVRDEWRNETIGVYQSLEY